MYMVEEHMLGLDLNTYPRLPHTFLNLPGRGITPLFGSICVWKPQGVNSVRRRTHIVLTMNALDLQGLFGYSEALV